MTGPKTVHLDDRAAFDSFYRECFKTDADKISLLMMVKQSKHPEAAQAYDMLAEAYYLETGAWPKLPKLN